MNDHKPTQTGLWGNEAVPPKSTAKKNGRQSKAVKHADLLPEKLGKAIRLPVPDFSDPGRKPTCLEADFPIAQINALSTLEGNAGKPIYQMSKWWARRRSSVFRSMLIAAATEAPDDPNEAAKLVWDHYYCNHQKAGSFKKLKVLDCFMGGGTTLVEGSRLGMQMTGIDLNPVAWFVVKNELACSDPEQVKALFDHIEQQVKPQIQPFYTTTCPRGHQGRWIDVESGEIVAIDPIDLSPEQRSRYRWEGPEVIYTFWAKHGPCQAKGCGHRTPIFKNPVIAEKKLTTYFIPTTCPSCGHTFNVEIGETRMSPEAERVVLDNEPSFTELSQNFAKKIKQYSQGKSAEKRERVLELLDLVSSEEGLKCPQCRGFTGNRIKSILDSHAGAGRVSDIKKKDFGIESRYTYMFLLLDPKWLLGTPGSDNGTVLGGYAGASDDVTSIWYQKRFKNLSLVEVRGRVHLADEEIEEPGEDEIDAVEENEEEKDKKKYGLPREIVLQDGTVIETMKGTVPRQAHFTCASCGREGNTMESVRPTGYTTPIAAYALQCHCPQCESERYAYGGRYFKALNKYDIQRLIAAETEWASSAEAGLADYWPRISTNPYPNGVTDNDSRVQNMDRWNYNFWWKMFTPRQLLVHTQLLKAITEVPEDAWPLDVREQALGAFQQYLRNQNMFAFYHVKRDCLAPALSNSNYHPKNAVVEVSAYSDGYGPWKSTSAGIIGGLDWAMNPWEPVIAEDDSQAKNFRAQLNDPVIPGNVPYCGSSTDLAMLGSEQFDLIITDPPFGNNLFYADLADFFYVWLRIPLRKWYAGLPEANYFESERSHRSLEAVDNKAEHPDDRKGYEKDPLIESKHLTHIRELIGDDTLAEKDPNPLYRPQPSSDFYSQTLSACWTEAGQRLKNGGIMAFTFHHSMDSAWNDVLKALFDAGYVLIATYPIRSDESKGEGAQFGSKTIEYDIIHVCRKRLEAPEPVSWARMRRWVKDETVRLKDLLEHTHGKSLPESDLRVILRGKSLEFYSRHYGQVFTGDGQVLDVRDALLGINQLLDDLLEDTSQTGGLRPPDGAEPASRLYLRLFKNQTEMERDELHKTLRGTGIAQGDLEARGWIRVMGRTVHRVPIQERLTFFTERGRNRKVIKTDLDQAHFLIGAAFPNSGLKIDAELNNPNFRIKRSVDEILKWVAQVDQDPANRMAARTAAQLVEHWRTRKDRVETQQQLSLFETLDTD